MELPIHYQPLFELLQHGIPQQLIAFQTLTLNDQFICIREQTLTASNVIIVDVMDPNNITKKPIKAESAIMSQDEKIIGLKLGSVLQVFKLSQPQPTKVGAHQMTDPVEYWTWISKSMIALVTNKEIYHWDLSTPGSEPVLICLRLPHLTGHRIVNYHVNHDLTWMCLIGIIQEGQRTVGHMQLHSTEKGMSQELEGHAANFSKGPKGDTIFSFVCRTAVDAKGRIV